ncbi:ubiquitin specific protease 16/45 isoform X2 [Leptinotarsa decemlineata]|uniref:ubiquitin specific protease 16/45 isoform X2 n=1 Tax=Leptinotarsa decemlineata TaxID=7539 RepID=UPI000C25394B|nr:ubiquitin carboxyl-terminal hydrolase 16 isoform X2 [Leptinotarsa decemlineata]
MNKKHQCDPNGDVSSESGDENQNNVECSHINKAVDLQKIKKSLTRTGFQTDCPECAKLPADNDMEDIEFDTSLWLCLKCGNQSCGRSRNKHALKHFETPHSDSHAMCVNTTVWSVWCYDCDDEVNMTCKKKLLEAVEFLRKQAESNRIKQQPNVTPLSSDRVLGVIPLPDSNTGTFPKTLQFQPSNLPRARGLSNLGNTCFFNSVMQCLGQTPYLLKLLEETSEEGHSFRLPGGNVVLENKEIMELGPLEGSPDKWRLLTASLAETLSELTSGRSEVYTPRMLFSRLICKMPQFGGGDQHDSHELLRHLLEAVREEDLKRYKSVILQKLGFNSKTDPATVEGDKKKIIKFYGQQASEMMSPTEQVFRGVLVSTLQCQECGHTSHRDEYFLDLSLPISEKQLPPVLRRKAEDLDDNKPSKHQIKKEKRAERKKNKKQKNNRSILNNEMIFTNSNLVNKSESESDADVEDNVEDQKNMQREVVPKGMESGYNSDKIDNSSPDSNNREVSPDIRVDSGVPSPSVGMLSVSPQSPDNSPASSETNLDTYSSSSLVCGNNSPNEDAVGEFERPESRLAFVNNKNADLKAGLEKLSLLNDGDSAKVSNLFNHDEDSNMEGACGPMEQEDEKMEEDDFMEEDESLWSGTISSRYQCEEGECSVQSCLNQFTECELMAGNNKVSCEMCTKRHGGPNNKLVYTDASKQLLIYNPPAVLILHLKRFQVYRFRSAKVSKFVKFTTLLDLAPFCSKRSQNLPTFEEGQTKVLYSLYGVVEHSGSIHGGHYVAYVKVRPPLEENSYRWQFLPKNQRQKVDGSSKGAQGAPEVPPGRWFYISDSYASEVQESKVLEAQAYLLFYERIM